MNAKGIALSAVSVGLLAAVVACTYRVEKYQRAFSAIHSAEKESEVTARFGPPTVRETSAAPYLRYAAEPCKAPCVERLWWEHPIFRGIEAWSVEFDGDGKVVHAAHWVSP